MPATHARNAPNLRLRTPESTAKVLQAHFARHNIRVLLLAAGTLVAALAAWLLLYLVCRWMLGIAFAVADVRITRIPRGFTIVFGVAAVCAIVYAWVDNLLTPNDRPRDTKPVWDVISEFVLAIPRMSLAVGGTLGAWQRLNANDFRQAAALLHRLADEKRLPMSTVRLDIPDSKAALRILFGLQITQVIDVHRDESEFWLRLNALRPDALRLARESYADA